MTPVRRSGAAPGPDSGPDHCIVDGQGLTIASAPRSVAIVRRYCTDRCSELGWAQRTDTVVLLVSEIATNAIRHARGTSIRVRLLNRGRRLRVEVGDDSATLPACRDAGPDAENGRGLAIVDVLAVSSGVQVVEGGKTVWFEVGG